MEFEPRSLEYQGLLASLYLVMFMTDADDIGTRIGVHDGQRIHQPTLCDEHDSR